jgi:two-component system, OmpR family, sensor histidine kinase CpxA
VRDHGPGVPEGDLQRLFDPFYRVSEARDRDSGGFGLGLAIAARAVTLHGGMIRAENVPGGGLRVIITLPASPSGS